MQMVETGEPCVKVQVGNFWRAVHEACWPTFEERRRKREAERNTEGGKAGAYHERQGRVIRKAKNL